MAAALASRVHFNYPDKRNANERLRSAINLFQTTPCNWLSEKLLRKIKP
jgi:hypothetical protein